jgi:hypothetical protein
VGLFLPPAAQPQAVHGVELGGNSNVTVGTASSGFQNDNPVANGLTAGCLSPSEDSPRVRDPPHERNKTLDAEEPQILADVFPTSKCESSRAITLRSTVVALEYATPQKTPFAIAETLVSVLATTVVANFVGLEAVKGMTREAPSTFSAVHTKYLRVVMDACKAYGGTVDLFYGDRIWAHFNAHRSAFQVTHLRLAEQC